MDDAFTAIADPTRRRIMEMLARGGSLSAGEIVQHFTISGAAISQHLKVLRDANLVTVEKRAQQRIYRINPATMQSIEGWVQQMTRVWTERFDALDMVLAAEKRKIRK